MKRNPLWSSILSGALYKSKIRENKKRRGARMGIQTNKTRRDMSAQKRRKHLLTNLVVRDLLHHWITKGRTTRHALAMWKNNSFPLFLKGHEWATRHYQKGHLIAEKTWKPQVYQTWNYSSQNRKTLFEGASQHKQHFLGNWKTETDTLLALRSQPKPSARSF